MIVAILLEILEFVKELVLKSQTLKYDGVMIETHDTPEKALSDSKQQIKPTEFNSFFINE